MPARELLQSLSLSLSAARRLTGVALRVVGLGAAALGAGAAGELYLFGAGR
jgi:hypothetical protein